MIFLNFSKNIKMNCIIIDENIEDLNLIDLKLKQFSNLQVVEKFSNFIDAKLYIVKNSVDLIIIEIGVEHENCFSFLDSLTENLKIIFTSYNTEFAFRSFNYNCIDYLKKPIQDDRLKKSIKKIIKQSSNKHNGNHIYVKSKLKKRKIYLTDIKWIEALGDYIKLITPSENIVILSSLKSFEKELPKDKFMRIHKSFIVSLDKIETYDSKNVFIDSSEIPLSRNKKIELDAILSLKNHQ